MGDFGNRARDKEALFASMTALINDDGATEDVEDVKKRMEDIDSLWDVLEASVSVRDEECNGRQFRATYVLSCSFLLYVQFLATYVFGSFIHSFIQNKR